MTESKSAVIQRVKACLRSEKDNELYKPGIISRIKASDDLYIKCTVDIIKKVIKDKKEDGFTKLFALFLLKEGMDTKNKDMVKYVQKKIMRRLGIIAKTSASPYFKPADAKSAVVDTFTKLLVECIVVWNEWFGMDNNNKVTKYRTIYNDVAAKIQIPKKKSYFVEPQKPDDKANRAPDRSGSMNQSNSGARTPANGKPVLSKAEEERLARERVANLEKLLARIKMLKETLLEGVDTDDVENIDTDGLVHVLKDLKACNAELKTLPKELFEQEFQHKDELIEQVLHDNELITNIISEYQKCVQNQTPLEDYQAFLLDVLSQDLGKSKKKPSQAPTPTHHHHHDEHVEEAKKAAEKKPEPPQDKRTDATSPINRGSSIPPPKPNDNNNKPPGTNKAAADGGIPFENFGSVPAEGPDHHHQGPFQSFGDVEQTRKGREEAKVDTGRPGGFNEPKPSAVDWSMMKKQSEGSEGGDARKPPRRFQDLFNGRNDDSMTSKGRRRGLGSDASRTSENSGTLRDTKVSGFRREQEPRGREGGLGIDAFQDYNPEATNTIEDSSVISQSGTFNFDYGNNARFKSPTGIPQRSNRDGSKDDQSMKWSPKSNVLEDYGRDTAGSRESSTERKEWKPEERKDPVQQHHHHHHQDLHVDTGPAPRNVNTNTVKQNPQSGFGQQINHEEIFDMKVFDSSFGAPAKPEEKPKIEDRTSNVKITELKSEPVIDVHHHHHHPHLNKPSTMTEIGTFKPSEPLVNRTSHIKTDTATKSLGEIGGSETQRKRAEPAADAVYIPSLLGENYEVKSKIGKASPGPSLARAPLTDYKSNTLSSVEKNIHHSVKFDTPKHLNLTTMSEDLHIRQADQLLDRARRLTSHRSPDLFNSGTLIGHSLLNSIGEIRRTSMERPTPLFPQAQSYFSTEPIQRGSVRIPFSTFDPMLPPPRRLSSEKFETFGSLTRTIPAGTGLLEDIKRSRDFSQSFSGHASRSFSEGPGRLIVGPPVGPPPIHLGPPPIHIGHAHIPMGPGPLPLGPAPLPSKYTHVGAPAPPPVHIEREVIVPVPVAVHKTTVMTPGRPAVVEKIEVSRGYNTGGFPSPAGNREMNRATELIEKAKRLREQTHMNLRRNSAVISTYNTPKGEAKYVNNLVGSVVADKGLRQSGVMRSIERMHTDPAEERIVEKRVYTVVEQPRVQTRIVEERRTTEPAMSDVTFYEGDRGLSHRVLGIGDSRTGSSRGYLAEYERAKIETPGHNRYVDRVSNYSSARNVLKTESYTDERVRDVISSIRKESNVSSAKRDYEDIQNGVGRKPLYEESKPGEFRKRMEYGKPPPADSDYRGRNLEKRYQEREGNKQSSGSNRNIKGTKRDIKDIIGGSLYYQSKENIREVESADIRTQNTQASLNPARIDSSPVRDRKERNAEIMELKPEENTRVVERPVPGGSVRTSGQFSLSGVKSPLSERQQANRETGQKVPLPTQAQAQISRQIYEEVQTRPLPQPQIQTQSQQLANQIRDEIEQLKRSLGIRKKQPETGESSAEVKSYESSKYQETIPRGRSEWRASEDPKADTMKIQKEVVRVQPVDITAERVNGRNDRFKYTEQNYASVGSSSSKYESQGGLRASGSVYENTVQTRTDKPSAKEILNDLNRTGTRRLSFKKESEVVPYGRDSYSVKEEKKLTVKELNAAPGVKLTLDNSDLWETGSSTREKFTRIAPVEDHQVRREKDTREKERFGGKAKWGRQLNFNYNLFDQITNAVYSNSSGKDVDLYKTACLSNKATLFDSILLKIDAITRVEDAGYAEGTLKLILHYTNKSGQSLSGFTVNISDKAVGQGNQVAGANLAPKYQLKQDLFLNFLSFQCLPYTIRISCQHEGTTQNFTIPLPLTINKFMKMKSTNINEYKKTWKTLKSSAVKSRYRHINVKFIRNPTELNKYFENELLDVTPMANPKRKKKYGGVFTLPDKNEYYIRIALDSNRAKFIAPIIPQYLRAGLMHFFGLQRYRFILSVFVDLAAIYCMNEQFYTMS